MTTYGRELAVHETPIPGLLVIDLPVHGDDRGWFKENWQREKLTALGVPDLGPVQNNISFNDAVGTTRGIHAEPWDKFISVATGRVFGAWVDLREGDSFGMVFTTEITGDVAIYVPRGIGNSYQSLEPDTSYTYLVNDHWSPEATYTFLNLADETVAIDWPIPLDRCELSDKDRTHPRLADVVPFGPRRTLVSGADGQLGQALRTAFAGQDHVDFTDVDTLDLTLDLSTARHWREYDTIINAAAYTAVDLAESPQGRAAAWKVNVQAVANLARVATENDLTLVHVSTDYVFDGTQELHTEDEPLTPLGVYGQTKAAGDVVAATVPRHYVLRTSWVIGDGNNFVRTMASLAERGIDPTVVDDQHGRLTFTEDLAAGITHLLRERPAYGTYNLSNDGAIVSWADIAKRVYELTGHDPARVTPVSTATYYAAAEGPISPRPTHSGLDLAKIRATGFVPRDADAALRQYLS
ncbi:MAG: bifunctional dTDP-4-dehydrorhamnose 3,5-epimerase family protein/NAD(P)-dependent oxidoreductase [Aeromicrobium sp.]|uniref:bifunctional dTDP-4-dehydrorhamnose 3,5-epimerase family protein/NAD(P)-dependent oxidoreductase n=1 Tax=Aeromicrobium sp. TaxID=1871063 RepID=UPI0025BE82B2|nr:bifunctional dTDP-4-dehydrorhamnose 3,5-epimerase family protein/NAD(P)-dependent oxidoreductase [Aeromicrobium sp.]MCK5890347.1 bifunctional dTDP-4-dehydrorhamnose 3,5-epimerase family protein/NAD(P)-dependent oxidoreductase [Aeromicrobium sp.]MDF1704934.1 bifunctional dTDP-4-dehydrorhamnose 3,5-epimerase family protein/NAD(P)-dependent oxidoreductase [Aeromicrobium sp.]